MFSIGALARETGVKVPTIRFYEQIGLLPEPERTESDRRVYAQEAVRRLSFIKHARQLGFSVEAIRSLLSLADHPDHPCDEANTLAAEQLAAVDAKIAQLQGLQSELRRIVEAACHGRVAECRVIEQLGLRPGHNRDSPTGTGRGVPMLHSCRQSRGFLRPEDAMRTSLPAIHAVARQVSSCRAMRV